MATLVLAAPLNTAGGSQKVRVIFDTDIAGDHDDVGPAAVLHSLVHSGEAEMGKGAEWGSPCLDAINTYYGCPDIPKPNYFA